MSMITLVCGLWVTMGAGLFAAICEKVTWIHYIYYLSYIKVSTTPIKYTPQVYLHYIRQSTDGWAVQSVFCDLCAGTLCILQMFIDAINNDDWDGTLGNPGKLGLGLISIAFNAIFLLQHFVLYRKNRKRNASRSSKVSDSLDDAFHEKVKGRLDSVHVSSKYHKLTQRVQDI